MAVQDRCAQRYGGSNDSLLNDDQPAAFIRPMPSSPHQDRLHGITLEAILQHLVTQIGWEQMSKQIDIKCFTSDPSISSSLKFLRKTPWARKKVEDLYLSLDQ